MIRILVQIFEDLAGCPGIPGFIPMRILLKNEFRIVVVRHFGGEALVQVDDIVGT